jgi:hypothetical protein
VRFPTLTPSQQQPSHGPSPASAGALWCLILAPFAFALAFLAATEPSLAQDFDLARLTEGMDIALEADRDPTGEFVASFALGGVDLDLRHAEFMGGMAQPYLYGRPKNNPLVRSSLASTGTQVSLAGDTTMPLGFSFGLDEWDAGNRNLRLIAHNGLHLDDLRLDHQLTLITSFAPDSTESRRSAGRLLLGFNLFGGRQEGVVEYDASPLTQVTHLRMNSEWRFDDGGTAMLGFTHQPLNEVSEARLGFRQPIGGGFELTSDIMADSGGGYAVGLQVALPFGPAPKQDSWSLSKLVSNLRAERLASAPVESDAFEDVN